MNTNRSRFMRDVVCAVIAASIVESEAA